MRWKKDNISLLLQRLALFFNFCKNVHKLFCLSNDVFNVFVPSQVTIKIIANNFQYYTLVNCLLVTITLVFIISETYMNSIFHVYTFYW